MKISISRHFTAFVLFTVLLPFAGSSQSNFSFSAGGGAIYYNGDLHDNNFLFPHGELINSYYNFEVTALLVDRLEMGIGYLHGKIEGDDALSSNKYNRKRNLTFFSPIDEFNLTFRLKLLSVRTEEIINPYAMAGFGMLWFNPQTKLNGQTIELQPLGTEGQYIDGGNNPAPYDLNTFTLNFGLGVQFRVSKNFFLRFEGSPHFTFTDYLDDVSTNYPDSAKLAGTPNGALAVQLSSRDERGFQEERIRRGNSTKNDVYITAGASIIFTPSYERRKYDPAPGILHKSKRTRRGWRK